MRSCSCAGDFVLACQGKDFVLLDSLETTCAGILGMPGTISSVESGSTSYELRGANYEVKEVRAQLQLRGGFRPCLPGQRFRFT